MAVLFFGLIVKGQSPEISFSTELTESTAKIHIETSDLTGKYISSFSFTFAYDSTEIIFEDYAFNEAIINSSIEASKIEPDTTRIAVATTGLYQGSGRLMTIDTRLLKNEAPTFNVVAIVAEGVTPNDISFVDTLAKNQTIELYQSSTSIAPESDGQISILPILYHSSYPNPFNPYTTIEYSLSKASKVQFSVYNIVGQRVYSLPTIYRSAGLHRVKINGSTLPSGVYYYELKVGSTRKIGSMVLSK